MRTAMLLLILCAWIPTVTAQPPAARPNVQAVRSPEVLPDRRVTFRLLAPKATEVSVAGEFKAASQAIPMEKDEKGLWSVTIGPLEPEIYNYNFTIDGVRTIDPNNPNVKTGSTPTTIMSIVEVRGDEPAFYDGAAVPHGVVHERWYQSKSLGKLRRLLVYLPPDYEHNRSAKYPALYLLHGANADENAWTRLGRANLILDNLLVAGKAKAFVVIMPFGYGVPPGSAAPGGAPNRNLELFSRDLIQDVIPFIEAEYRIYNDRDHRAIAGLSMGGNEALTIGLTHLELFSRVAGFSAAIRPTGLDKTFTDVIANPEQTNRKLHLLWVSCGTEDGLLAANQSFSAFLKQHNIQHQFRTSAGEHTWIVWRRNLRDIAPLLFAKESVKGGTRP